MKRAAPSVAMPGTQAAPSAPNVNALPKPAAPAPDLASIAEKYNQIRSGGQTAGNQAPDLLVFVSLSMPGEALERVVQQAQQAGATLVFRGIKNDSMMAMGKEVERILKGRNVPVAIHPPAFQRFSVTRVPAVVLAKQEAHNSIMENGCSTPETFVKVSGDVSIDYALDYIERKSPAWAQIASQYRSRIVRGVN